MGGTQLPLYTISLDEPYYERLVRVEMWCHVFDGTYELGGLRFTKRIPQVGGVSYQTSDVFGSDSGDYYDLSAPENSSIKCFFGRHGLFVDALGIYVDP
jgi:hypothetical protein